MTNEQSRDRSPAIDVPEADALEPDEEEDEAPRIPLDVPEADALDQSRDAELDEEDYQH